MGDVGRWLLNGRDGGLAREDGTGGVAGVYRDSGPDGWCSLGRCASRSTTQRRTPDYCRRLPALQAQDALLQDIRPASAQPAPGAHSVRRTVPSAEEDHQPDRRRARLPWCALSSRTPPFLTPPPSQASPRTFSNLSSILRFPPMILNKTPPLLIQQIPASSMSSLLMTRTVLSLDCVYIWIPGTTSGLQTPLRLPLLR